MNKRIAIVGIIIEDSGQNKKVQEILHQYGEFILGRMGIPRVEERMNIISVVVRAEQKDIAALSGKLGNLEKVTAKAIYKQEKKDE